jgi:hypothetical protein
MWIKSVKRLLGFAVILMALSACGSVAPVTPTSSLQHGHPVHSLCKVWQEPLCALPT